MKIVLWIGNQSNQKALANKIHAQFPLAGIVKESRVQKRKLTISKFIQAGIDRTILSPLVAAWRDMMSFYNKNYPDYPDTRVKEVENINSDEAYNFTRELQPDLIIVSGTRLVKKRMLEIPVGRGILNLHTGLSPYIKGGPNCTNWCIATGDFHLIGNTIMWIDAGIDSGNILTTEFTDLSGDESLSALHLKVMEHAHDLYLRAIKFVAEGKTQAVAQQSVDPGHTFYNKEWTLKQKMRVLKNLRRLKIEIESGRVREKQAGVKTISL